MFCCLVHEPGQPAAHDALASIARACSPRVERHGERAVMFDVRGLARVIGAPAAIAQAVADLAVAESLRVHIAIASTMTTAWLLARARSGQTVVLPGEDAAALSSLSLAWLPTLGDLDVSPRSHRTREDDKAASQELLATLAGWGLSTLGDLAALQQADVHARLGALGVRWHQAARGEDAWPIVPEGPAEMFTGRLELDSPIDGLEPLAFVLSRVCDRLEVDLERADRGAVAIHTTLSLVSRTSHTRTVRLPTPLRDARVLRTLVLLDLESHPPDAGVDVVEIVLDVAPGEIRQGALFRHTLPTSEDLSTLLARLSALMGTSRVGAPKIPDTHDSRRVEIAPFTLRENGEKVRGRVELLPSSLFPLPLTSDLSPLTLSGSLRRYRLPIAARVVTDRGVPKEVTSSARHLTGGKVVMVAGPWRTSGEWWARTRSIWDRDEWDVELADGSVYLLAHDRLTDRWTIDGQRD